MDEARRKAMAEALMGDKPVYGFYPHLNPRASSKPDTLNTPEHRAALVEGLLGIAPGSGEALSARDAWNASGRAGEALLAGRFGEAASGYADMGVGLLGALPGAGIIARGTKRGAAWMDKNVPAWTNKLLDAMMPADPKNTTFTFAGPAAKTADHQALATAQDMAGAGASRDDIWRDTGWFQGVDGKWRFEIDDSGAVLSPGTTRAFDELWYGQHLDRPAQTGFTHPQLHNAYDDFGDLNLTKTHSRGGSYEQARPRMTVDKRELPAINEKFGVRAGDPEEARSVALHEFQHGVQTREGFARGGNWQEMLQTPEAKAAVEREYARMKASGVNLADEDILANAETTIARDMYKRLAGEAEARNVQSRMNMSPAERRSTPPWLTQDVLDEQQIVRQR